MRDARGHALDELEPSAGQLRALAWLRERGRGFFYRGGTAFLHFHKDPAGLFADVRLGQDFDRQLVSTPEQHAALLTLVRRCPPG